MKKTVVVMVAFCLFGASIFAQTEDVLSLQDAIALYEDDKTLTDDGDRVIEIIKDLVAEDINATDDFSKTALMYASTYNYTEIVKSLIAIGANIDAKTKYGYTALMLATYGHTEIVALLIEAGADLEAKSIPWDTTALMMAAANGYTEIATVLIAGGANIMAETIQNVTALHEAARKGHTETVVFLIEAGADLEACAYGDGNDTVLIMAAEHGQTEVVKTLIEAGANIEAKTNWDTTALMYAADGGHTEVAKALIEAGADIEAKNRTYNYNNESFYGGNTALIIAALQGHTETVASLIAAGANIAIKDDDGNTALILAALKGHTETVVYLIAAGATIDINDYEGNTAVDFDSKNGHTDIVALLEKIRTAFQEIGKTYRTTDNLRLRQNEGTAGTPLFTLPKGASVKVLAQGNVQTIDGIRANWVQVEVLSDTVSVQGDTIAKGSVGWCFGGYLGEL